MLSKLSFMLNLLVAEHEQFPGRGILLSEHWFAFFLSFNDYEWLRCTAPAEKPLNIKNKKID